MAEKSQYLLLQKMIIQSLNDLKDSNINIQEKIQEINVTLVRNTDSLQDQAEKLIAQAKRTDLLEEQMKPLKALYNWGTVSGKIIGIVALIVGIIGGLVKG